MTDPILIDLIKEIGTAWEIDERVIKSTVVPHNGGIGSLIRSSSKNIVCFLAFLSFNSI